MTKEDCFCDSCGAKVVEYRHTLNAGLINSLGELYRAGGEAHLADLNLTYNQKNNFQKLRYWFLVTNHERSGVWSLTERGWDFVDGVISIPKVVWTYRGAHVRFDEPIVLIRFREQHNPSYASADDYWAEAVPHFLR